MYNKDYFNNVINQQSEYSTLNKRVKDLEHQNTLLVILHFCEVIPILMAFVLLNT